MEDKDFMLPSVFFLFNKLKDFANVFYMLLLDG